MRTANYIFSVLLLVIITTPIWYELTKANWAPSLKGYMEEPETVDLKWETLSDQRWQNFAEEHLKRNMRIRNFLVRLNNQLKYSLFDILKTPGIVQGKEGHFFGEMIIESYLGTNYVGSQAIEDTVSALAVIRDSLKANGTEFIFVIAPGKAYVHPEFIPDHWLQRKKDTTNYMVFKQKLTAHGIPVIDFITVFQQMRDTMEYPLLPEAGLHWSLYAGNIAADSLLKRIELSLQADLPDAVEIKEYSTDWPRKTDGDVADALNLLAIKTNESYKYTEVKNVNDKGKFRPNVLGVGDSYYWTFMYNGIHRNFYSPESQFYFYFKDIYSAKRGKPRNVDDIQDLRADLCSRDVIVLVCSDGTLYKSPYGFIDKCNKAFGITE